MSFNNQFQPGDHLVVQCMWNGLPYSHHGIVVDESEVIHYERERGIVRVSLAEFCESNTPRIRHYTKCDSEAVVIECATGRLGETNYHLAFNNCEDFATYCKTGKGRSDQVMTGLGVGGAAATAGKLAGAAFLSGGAAAGNAALIALPVTTVIATGLGVGLGVGFVFGFCKAWWQRYKT